jgi:hypothetical protein
MPEETTVVNALRYHLRTYGLLDIAQRHPRLLARLMSGRAHSATSAMQPMQGSR